MHLCSVRYRSGWFCRPTILSGLLLCLAVFGPACFKRAPVQEQSPRQEDSVSATSAADALRIVSLSPAISRTLRDMELDGYIVGRTPFCDSLDQRITVVGDLLEIDYERLVRLQPTHVLVQPPASGVDPHLIDIAARRGWMFASWMLNDREDIEQMVREMPQIVPANSAQLRAQVSARAAQLLQQMEAPFAPSALHDMLWKGRVLLIANAKPVLAFGRETYLDDMLTAFGSQNAIPQRGWYELSMEDVIRVQPEAIILVRPGGTEQRGLEAAAALLALDLPAVRNHRIAVLTHEAALLPSSGIIGVAEALREILTHFHQISAGGGPS